MVVFCAVSLVTQPVPWDILDPFFSAARGRRPAARNRNAGALSAAAE
jgi:hypothetical protein